jgi:hypothetical protein
MAFVSLETFFLQAPAGEFPVGASHPCGIDGTSIALLFGAVLRDVSEHA